MKIGELYKSEDWKTEKHVPVIECADAAAPGEIFKIRVTLGKEVSHPNTTEHHIRWVQVYFKPEGEGPAYQLANVEFTAHGESTKGANEGPASTHHEVTVAAILSEPGTIIATSYCNIHGLWENSVKVPLTTG